MEKVKVEGDANIYLFGRSLFIAPVADDNIGTLAPEAWYDSLEAALFAYNMSWFSKRKGNAFFTQYFVSGRAMVVLKTCAPTLTQQQWL